MSDLYTKYELDLNISEKSQTCSLIDYDENYDSNENINIISTRLNNDYHFQKSFKNIFKEEKNLTEMSSDNNNAKYISKLDNDILSQPFSIKNKADIIINIDNPKNIDNNSQINFLNKKRKLSTKEEFPENEKEKTKINDNTPPPDNNDENKKENNFGRKKKTDNIPGKHTKYADDNIIQKIKGRVTNFPRDMIYKISNGKYDLKKLKNEHKAQLKIEVNKKLLTETIGNIFSSEEISKKYSTFESNENSNIIKRIKEEKEENKILIKILDLTFGEVLILFRRKINYEKDKNKLEKILNKFNDLNFLNDNNKYQDAEYFIEELKRKGNDDEYIEKVKNLCCGYESWFENRKERNPKNNFKSNCN